MPRTYYLTAGAVISKARVLLEDANSSVGLRATDAELLGWLNDALDAMVPITPGLFSVTGAFTCASGYLQTLEADRAVAFGEVIGLPLGDQATLTQFSPGWQNATASAAREWMPAQGDPLRFLVYPPSAPSQSLLIRYVKAPDPLTSTSSLVPVPEVYEPVLVDYVTGRAEVANDESVDNNRAMALMEKFVSGVRAIAG